MKKTDAQLMAEVGITDFRLIDNIVIDQNSPDPVDMWIESADYDGFEMTERQIEMLGETSCLQSELIHDYFH